MTPVTAAHPFALMLHPELVVQAMERSERLERLQRRICRPLDRPLLDGKGEASDFDRAVDAEDAV